VNEPAIGYDAERKYRTGRVRQDGGTDGLNVTRGALMFVVGVGAGPILFALKMRRQSGGIDSQQRAVSVDLHAADGEPQHSRIAARCNGAAFLKNRPIIADLRRRRVLSLRGRARDCEQHGDEP